jgi:hypothetical protein
MTFKEKLIPGFLQMARRGFILPAANVAAETL